MRRPYSTLTPAVVHATAARFLTAALPWQPFGSLVTVPLLIDLLLLAAALRASLSAVVKRFHFGFSHETARQALAANLPPLPFLTRGLVHALYGLLPHALRRRRWDVAIDLHYVPFYGAARTPGTLGGPQKHGTQRFFVYATAVIVQRGQRWCVGLAPVSSTRGDQAVAQLLEQMRQHALRIRCLLLDRGFFSGHIVRLLQARQLPYVIGVQRKKGRLSQRFTLPSGQLSEHAWKTERGGLPVRTCMVTLRRRRKGRWRREVYAFEGIEPDGAVRRYQRARFYRRLNARRFGIETSYRQMNPGKGRTTSTDPRWRLLGLGLALLLRQVWVWLQQQLTPRGTRWKDWQPYEALRLAILLEWLVDGVKHRYPECESIPLPRPLQLPAPEAVAG